jgi:hypothetical protein
MKEHYRALPLILFVFLIGCGENQSTEEPAASATVSVEEMQSIARDAYVYGFPLVMNLKTLYEYSIDGDSPNYKAPVNQIQCEARVFTPADTSIVTPNSDTPYCMFWMDLRTEPLVLTVPEVESDRYYGAQLIDFYTHNYAYVGTRTNNNAAGSYLLVGPGWSGDTPAGISEVLSSETDIIFSIIRTQLFGADDLEQVVAIQAQYGLQPLSEFLGQTSPEPLPPLSVPEWAAGSEFTVAAFDYIDAALHLIEAHPDEADMLARFAELGLGSSDTFSTAQLDPTAVAALEAGMQQAIADIRALIDELSPDPLSSAKVFGTRDFLVNAAADLGQQTFYLQRAGAAITGLYGNSGAEAIYPTYFVDNDGQPLDAGQHAYAITFAAADLPPAKAFWSLSMYDGVTQLFIDNPLDRYLINSPMMDSFEIADDGSLTIYVQNDSPGSELESNWLPAPDGPFYAVLRLYLPEESVLEGQWTPPKMVKVN